MQRAFVMRTRDCPFYYDAPAIIKELKQGVLVLLGKESDGPPALQVGTSSFDDVWQEYYAALRKEEAERLKKAYEVKCQERLPFKEEARQRIEPRTWRPDSPCGWEKNDDKNSSKSIVTVVAEKSKRHGCTI
jgi:hypothetical protein